jgi:hypothetical protein
VTSGRAAPIGLAIGVGLIAFVWLQHVNPPFQVTDDGIRDQLLARDCTDLGRCHMVGASTSLPGFHQGAVWLDLLIAVRLFGGDVADERTVVLGLLALSVATLFVVLWRWVRPSIALPAALILIAALGLDVYPSLLINPSPSAFPDVLCAAGLLCYALSGRRRFLVVAAFALGVGINVHVGALSLVPALFAIVGLVHPRPWRDVLVALAVLLATCLVTSSAALRANVMGLTEHGRLAPVLASGLAVILISAAFGPRFRRRARPARAWIVGAILVVPFTLASLWLVVQEQHHFGITYLHPVLGPAAAVAAALLCLPFELAARWARMLRWIPTSAAVAAIAAVAVQVHNARALAIAPASPGWTIADGQTLGDHLLRRGWSYEDLQFRIQGRDCRELLTTISVAAPPPHATDDKGHRQVQVVKVDAGAHAAADHTDVVSLGGRSIALVREIDSWLRPESLTACRIPLGAEEARQCTPAEQTPAEALGPARFLFARRTFPSIHHLDLLPPYTAVYEIPLAPVAGESRDIVLSDATPSGREWRITRVEGVRVEGQLPATRVRLHSDSGAPGLLVIEKPFAASARAPVELDMRYPPCVLEAAPGDPPLGLGR